MAPRDGLNVVLTIDAGLQNIVECELAEGAKAHAPISISCVMVRPRTGEILAMATLPNFDPNHPGPIAMDDLRNRVISDYAEPGSTFKIVPVTAALNEHLVTLNDVFDCGMGHFFYAGRMLHDHEPYGPLSVEKIITKSSNIGAAKIGIRLGEQTLWEYIHKFGFGQRTGIPLPGRNAGLGLAGDELDQSFHRSDPHGPGHSRDAAANGHGHVAPLANNGVLMRPMLVNRLEEPSGKVAVQVRTSACPPAWPARKPSAIWSRH